MLPLRPPNEWLKKRFVFLLNKMQLQSNKVCYKVSLCENFQRQSCSIAISRELQPGHGSSGHRASVYAGVGSSLGSNRLCVQARCSDPVPTATDRFIFQQLVLSLFALFTASDG